jgi:uncharacterized ion transporter superfamily protein YfcC
MIRRFSIWLSSSGLGHMVLFLMVFSIPLGIWSLSVNDWPNPMKDRFAIQFLAIDAILGAVVGLAIWNFVTKPFIARRRKRPTQ